MTIASSDQLINRIAQDGCVPFTYDAESQTFQAGEFTYGLSASLGPQMFTDLRGHAGVSAEELAEYPLVDNGLGGLYALPLMQKAMSIRGCLDDTARVMQDAYESLMDEHLPLDFFEANFAPNGSYEARVLGSATLHAIAYGYIGERGWPFNIFEYSTNNADMPEEELTLIAGIGHIAKLVTDQ
jgi:hypothetical protein